MDNPELGVERIRTIYKSKGYADEWIETRLKTIDIRKQLTDEWQQRGVKEGQEYVKILRGLYGKISVFQVSISFVALLKLMPIPTFMRPSAA